MGLRKAVVSRGVVVGQKLGIGCRGVGVAVVPEVDMG